MRGVVARRIRKTVAEIYPEKGSYIVGHDGSIRLSVNAQKRKINEAKRAFRDMRTQKKAKRERLCKKSS